jgi:hypothetical protein
MRLLSFLLVVLASASAHAATSSGVAPSPMGGNGHNVTFDGRVFVVAQGDGWNLRVLRPERVNNTGAFPDVSDAFTPPTLIQPVEQCENALALCEPSADDTPYACDEDGNRGGPFACYDLVVIDSNACGVEPNILRSRNLKVWVESPGTADAAYHKHAWSGARTPLSSSTSSSGQLRGIEPTVTKDGKLLVWQGHPANDGQIDILMYATNESACGTTGWRGPFNLSHMQNDPNVVGRYRLAERTLRAADGSVFTDGVLLHGAYPWLFPDGSAVSFTSVTVPCRAENDPAGCGPRRGGLAVLGYPTNWGVAHIDGPVNPDTDNTVRLFFSSPGPTTFQTLPVTDGVDVWPFFGSNTSNYTEIVFDDGLDGNYAGVWLMNESVTRDGNLDRTRTPDTSGYFNTGVVENATFPLRNEGPRGKTLAFNGTSSRVRVPDDVSLDPVNGITVEMTLRPDAPVDCDGNNNWRVLLDKGGVGQGAYSLVLEEGQNLQRGADADAAMSSALGHPRMLKLLLDRGAHPHGAHVSTCVVEAARDPSRVTSLKLLLEYGAEPDFVSTWKRRPLFLAVEYGSLDAARALLDAGAAPLTQDDVDAAIADAFVRSEKDFRARAVSVAMSLGFVVNAARS